MSRIPREVLEDLKKVGVGLGLWDTDAELDALIERMSDDQVAALMKLYTEFHNALDGIEQGFQTAKRGLAEIQANALAKLRSL